MSALCVVCQTVERESALKTCLSSNGGLLVTCRCIGSLLEFGQSGRRL